MRAIRLFVGLLFVLAIGLVGCDADAPEPTLDPGIVSALAPACSGHAIGGSGAITTSGNPINHIVLLDSTGRPFEMTDWLPPDWQPTSVADTELVACVPAEPLSIVLEVCPYVGSDITRYQVERDFEVIEPASGRVVAAFAIIAEPRECNTTENASLTELRGQIDDELVTAHLAGLVEHGRFIDPDAAGPSVEPGRTVPPGQTIEPGQTPGTSDDARTAELRQALADGMVSVSGTGDDLQSLDLELTSEVDFDLEVTIEAGTLLEPRARGTQRMVVTDEQMVYLAADATASASLDVACVEMHRDQPTGDDSFRVLDDTASGDLALLLATPEFSAADGRVRQFAVWTITNNPRRGDYVGLSSGFSVFGTGPDDEELAAIVQLFDMADIDMGKYRALRGL